MTRSPPFFVDAYVEISHAARELFGKIQILCFGVPRHAGTTAVMRAGDRKPRDRCVVGYVAHPFGQRIVRLGAVARDHFVALHDYRRKNNGKQRDQPEKGTEHDERDLSFLTRSEFTFVFLFRSVRLSGSGLRLFRRNSRGIVVILHIAPRNGIILIHRKR